MSQIEKLAIRASALPPDREQAIEFESPLTMIVGANGQETTGDAASDSLTQSATPPPRAAATQNHAGHRVPQVRTTGQRRPVRRGQGLRPRPQGHGCAEVKAQLNLVQELGGQRGCGTSSS